MKITILNKNNFNKLMIDSNITPKNVGDIKDLYLISINDTEGKSYFEDTLSSNLLVTYFDDVIEDTESLKAITTEQGEEIYNFIKSINITPNTHLVVHCSAGQNRSGSVGKFAADYFKYNQKRLMVENPIIKGNSTVTRILNKLWLWSHYN